MATTAQDNSVALAANKVLVARLIALWNRGDPAAMADLIAPDYVHHTSQGVDIDFNGFQQGFAWLGGAFPDFHHTIQHMIAEEDRVAVFCHSTATHRGTFFDLAPTGRPIIVNWMYHCRIERGKIREDWDVMNFQAILASLRRP